MRSCTRRLRINTVGSPVRLSQGQKTLDARGALHLAANPRHWMGMTRRREENRRLGGIYGPILFRKGALRRGQRDRTAGIYPAFEWEDRASLALMECALFLLIRSSASWAMSPRRLKKSWSASCAIRLNQPLQSSVGTSWRRGRRMSVLLLGDSSIRVRFCHEGPQDPSVLVGDGDAGSIGTAETRLLGDPATPGIGLRCGSRHDGTCSMDQQ